MSKTEECPNSGLRITHGHGEADWSWLEKGRFKGRIPITSQEAGWLIRKLSELYPDALREDRGPSTIVRVQRDEFNNSPERYMSLASRETTVIVYSGEGETYRVHTSFSVL